MIVEEIKVGPRGQVVMPPAFCSALKIAPGSKVIVRLEKDRVIVKKKVTIDATVELEKLAKRGRSVDRIPPHMYEEQFETTMGS
jgi:bifunctional DNA-binding transcriptional regulator/antitoxin component of YhaV-PrlF toxin-antitoxin module